VEAREHDPNVNVRGHDGPLMEFIYQEAIRGLVHQQNVVEGLNTRAGNLIFASLPNLPPPRYFGVVVVDRTRLIVPSHYR
jgi:hypothetical protein